MRITKAILCALGAQSDFRDAIIGDLDEEFAERSTTHGASSAKRWYQREAMRAAPHLLRDWSRNCGARDMRDLAFCVGASLLCVAMLAALASAAAQALLPNARYIGIARTANVALALSALAAGTLGAIMGGYVAARLHARAPLIGAATLAGVWCLLSIAGFVLDSGDVAAIIQIGAPVSVLLGTLLGGVLRVQQASTRRAGSQERT